MQNSCTKKQEFHWIGTILREDELKENEAVGLIRMENRLERNLMRLPPLDLLRFPPSGSG